MCTPTRGQLMTGMDACRNGATTVCAGRSFVRPGIPTMADIFAAARLQDGHLRQVAPGRQLSEPAAPPRLPRSVYHLGWGITSMADTWQNDYFDGRFFHNGELQEYPGYCTDVWFDLSLDWMKERQAKQRAVLPLPADERPARPALGAGQVQAAVSRAGGPAAFFGMIANLDENIGRLEKFLDESGLADNTIVIFLHDNGGTAGVNTFNAGMRGRKTTYYEGGHRAACFIRWPGGKLRSRATSTS